MKEVTKYAADDGTVFDTAEEAIAYENLLLKLAAVDLLLRPVPTTVEFANGDGYVQQGIHAIGKYTEALGKETEKRYRVNTAGPHGICRMLSDTDEPHAKELRRRWGRLLCIDRMYREWGQPYYAMHPENGKLVEVGHAD